jgi:hypothetical protein
MKNGGDIMKRTNDVKFTLVFGLLAIAALTFALFPGQAIGQDYDKDGLPDSVEKYPGGTGITLLGGTKLLPCTGATGEDRHNCLNSQTPDLFVILVRATGCLNPAPTCTAPNVRGPCAPSFGGSNIPSKPYATAAYDPWELVEAPKGQGGLGITIHEITPSQAPASRVVYSSTGQKALKITESLDTCGTDLLGYSTWGTPNTTGVAVLYTQRIKNKIDKECAAAPNNCIDVTTGDSTRDLLYVDYIQSLLVHELGHVMALTKLWTPSYGGPHEVSGSGFIMEQQPIVKVISGSSVKWYISDIWSGQSKSDFNLLK